MSLLKVDGLGVSYPREEEPAIRELSFSMEAGETLGIVGESGAGKSQAALGIMGLLPANARQTGSIELDGTEIVGANSKTLRGLRASRVSMVFQDPATALNPYVRVGKQLKHILVANGHARGTVARKKCIELLTRVGLPNPERQYRSYPHQLSGGMRQRALIAAALIGDPDIIVADEPTTALDVTIQAQILDLLSDLRAELNTALLLITHDLGVIARCCDRLLVMDRGEVVERGDSHAVFANPQNAHTAKLVNAVPRLDVLPPDVGEQARESILNVRQLGIEFRERRYGRRDDITALDAVDIDVAVGETLAIVGESGSGKTTLARCIAGLLPGHSGSIKYHGDMLPWRVEERPKSLRRQLQMVFQDPVSSLNPAMRVGNILAEPYAVHAPKMKGHAISQAVNDMLDRVGLDHGLKERFPHELSGGQAQRVAIARALATEPAILICDEALAALDGTVRAEILSLLKSVQKESSLSLIMITHDLGLVRNIADRIVVMHRGKVCETANNEDLFSNPQHEYTRSLLAAIPTL